MGRTEKDWPRTLEEAVDRISSTISDEDKESARNTSDADLMALHFGLGMAIRNDFGLWAGNTDLLRSALGFDSEELPIVPDADTASTEIIRAVRDTLRNG